MSIFTKKSKLVFFKETQKEEMIDKLESQNIEYSLKIKEGELANERCYEFVIAQKDLKKVS